MPTIALSNSIAFHQMSDPGKQFPWIRVFGTVGWIVAGLMISALQIEKSALTFHMAAISSLALGILSFILPNTPPKGKNADASVSNALGADAFVLFKNKPYLIFFIAAILVCIPLSFYYGLANLFLNQAGMENAAGKMTMGQVSEALFILAIPFLFNSIGVKNMIITWNDCLDTSLCCVLLMEISIRIYGCYMLELSFTEFVMTSSLSRDICTPKRKQVKK